MGDLNPLAVALAAAALVFVMIRLTLTFRQNVGMLRTSRDEALTDALTGLGNRRALTRALDEALEEAVPESPVVLALFDLDGFKHYNDTFGHPAGDVLLARLGGNLKAFLGARGTVFRMGGDEFCALFEPRLEDRVALLDGAALALSEQGEDFWIGCSYGSIAIPTEATDAAEALRIADQRMYAQKHAGRMSAARQVKESLLTVLGARDPALVRHARTVADLAEATARALDLSHAERETIRLAAELHEAGRLMLQGTLGVLGPRGRRRRRARRRLGPGDRPRRAADRRAARALADDPRSAPGSSPWPTPTTPCPPRAATTRPWPRSAVPRGSTRTCWSRSRRSAARAPRRSSSSERLRASFRLSGGEFSTAPPISSWLRRGRGGRVRRVIAVAGVGGGVVARGDESARRRGRTTSTAAACPTASAIGAGGWRPLHDGPRRVDERQLRHRRRADGALP